MRRAYLLFVSPPCVVTIASASHLAWQAQEGAFLQHAWVLVSHCARSPTHSVSSCVPYRFWLRYTRSPQARSGRGKEALDVSESRRTAQCHPGQYLEVLREHFPPTAPSF